MSNKNTPAPAAPDTAPYDVTEQVGHLLRKAYQRHTAIFQQQACDPQLTSIQFVTLCALRDHGPSSQAELIKATAVDQATIRGIVERLKTRGLIELSPDPDDRRKVIVGLTDSGAALLDAMIPCARQISELSMGCLNAAERVAILFLLRKMIDGDDQAG
ncbi:TPA: winged helix DNA-binding protein [Pseudomonas putida]|nr:winged helix DNA-binding protein [Pseudomonas putida]HEN8714835.1 winged helix DNA-binding protein [Pseudomonas putida]